MDREIILNKIKFFGVYFSFIISIMELVCIILLFITNIKLSGGDIMLFLIIFNLDHVSLITSALWVGIILMVVIFVVVGFLLLKFSSQKIIEEKLYAQRMFLIGVIIIMLCFFELVFIYKIEGKLIGNTLRFLTVISNFEYMPIYSYYLWRFLTLSKSYFIILGIVIAATGLHWLTVIREQNKTSSD